MALTGNKTSFAQHYLKATELLLESLATPRRDGFENALYEAIRAFDCYGDRAEWELGQQLAADIQAAAHFHGIHTVARWDEGMQLPRLDT